MTHPLMRTLRKILLVILIALAGRASAQAESPKDMLSAGRVDEVIGALQARIGTTPDDAESYNLLCRSYYLLGNWDRGVSACEKAVALQPNNSRYHLWLGRIYGEKASHANFFSAAGLAKKVRAEFETAVKLNSDSVEARTDLAEFYLEAPSIVGGGREKAEAQAQTLSRLDPAKAHWVIARIAEKQHDSAAAEKEYRAAVEASHSGANAWINLAFFYRHEQRFDDMENAIHHAASAQMTTPEVLMEGAETLIETGRNTPFALELLRRYLSNPMVEQAPAFKAHYLLGTVLEKQGNRQAAEQEYRASLSLARSFAQAQEALNRLNR